MSTTGVNFRIRAPGTFVQTCKSSEVTFNNWANRSTGTTIHIHIRWPGGADAFLLGPGDTQCYGYVSQFEWAGEYDAHAPAPNDWQPATAGNAIFFLPHRFRKAEQTVKFNLQYHGLEVWRLTLLDLQARNHVLFDGDVSDDFNMDFYAAAPNGSGDVRLLTHGHGGDYDIQYIGNDESYELF